MLCYVMFCLDKLYGPRNILWRVPYQVKKEVDQYPSVSGPHTLQ